MSSPPALPPIHDHEIHVFQQLDRPLAEWSDDTPTSLLTTAIGELANATSGPKLAGRCIPESIRDAMRARYGAEPVWQDTKVLGGAEFHPHLRRLVSGEATNLAIFRTATPLTLRLFENAAIYMEDTPRDARTTRRLVWVPSPIARTRLAAGGVTAADPLYAIEIVSLMAYAFRTGISFVHAAIRVSPIAPKESESPPDPAAPATPKPKRDNTPRLHPLLPVELQEAVVALTRTGRLGWLEAAGNTLGKEEFRLGTILRTLVDGGAAEDAAVDRNFAFTYARFAAPVSPAAADRYGFYLARHYTSDYAARDDVSCVVRVRDFDTVGHVITLEGAATVIAPEPATGTLPPFLENYATGTLHQHYIPISLLALHEHAFLVNNTTESNHWDDLSQMAEAVSGSDPEAARLRRLREESLQFRLGFRFSQVSLISMHNAVNRGFREALGLDRMLQELSDDVAEATAFLDMQQRKQAAAQRAVAEAQRTQAARQREADEDRRKQNERRFLALVWAAIAIGAGLSVFNVVNEFAVDLLSKQAPAAIAALVALILAAIVIFLLLGKRDSVSNDISGHWQALQNAWRAVRGKDDAPPDDHR